MSNFIDEVVIQAKAGDGGNGIVAWRREAHVALGGPAGGDGGNGGSVTFVGDENMHSLLDYKYKPHLTAKSGASGRGKNSVGESGPDIVARVPLGTQIYDADSEELLIDITTHGQVYIACKGGSGGWGNSHFATPSRQAPEFAKPGLPGAERRLRLSLKVMADVGLLGFPNAGKSTFLSRVSAARPKIANYPFTTLVPQLGVVRVDDSTTFVIADIPGVIEGASEGAGLGIRFLKHLERVRILCHLIEVPLDVAEGAGKKGDADSSMRLVEGYKVLRRELEEFSEDLAAVPEIVVVNKIDLLTTDAAQHPACKKLAAHLKKKGVPLYFTSAAVGTHLHEVLFALGEAVRVARAPTAKAPGPFNPLEGDRLR